MPSREEVLALIETEALRVRAEGDPSLAVDLEGKVFPQFVVYHEAAVRLLMAAPTAADVERLGAGLDRLEAKLRAGWAIPGPHIGESQPSEMLPKDVPWRDRDPDRRFLCLRCAFEMLPPSRSVTEAMAEQEVLRLRQALEAIFSPHDGTAAEVNVVRIRIAADALDAHREAGGYDAW